jgi:hypothetical protein
MSINRWREQRRPLARAVDLPMLAIVMTIEIAGIVLIAFLAARF